MRDDLVTALNRAKQTKDFSESTGAINTVLYMLSELRQVKIETPETTDMSLENSKEPSLQEYLKSIGDAVKLLNQIKQRNGLDSEDLRALEAAEKMLEYSPNDIVNELNSHTRRISKIPFDEDLDKAIAVLNASDKANVFIKSFCLRLKSKLIDYMSL